MTVFYLLGINIFHVLVFIASAFNPKAKLWIKGRNGLFKKMKEQINPGDKIAWFHCASLGEFEQGRPLIETFKEKHPDYKVLLTFFSPSGFEIRKNYEKADYIFYLPLDTPLNAKKFLDITKPSIIFFIKYEFWYYFIKEIGKRSIPFYLVSGIFRPNQQFFKKYAFKSRSMLQKFTHFFVQNQESKELLLSINLSNVTVTGDTRFDRVFAIAQSIKELPIVEKFKAEKRIMIAGSTWKPDEEIIIKWYNQNRNTIKLIIAPHETNPENINRIMKLFSSYHTVLKYSEATEMNIVNFDVLIVDSIGLLSSLYKYGDIAYIGGGFGKGIHNTLEAATFGLPILFGPNYAKFKEAIDLIRSGAASSINDLEQFNSILNGYLDNPKWIIEKGKISQAYVEENRGASKMIMENISENIK